MRQFVWAIVVLVAAAGVGRAVAPAPLSTAEVRAAMRRAAAYYQTRAYAGGYLWWYAADGGAQGGEFPANATTVWVQTPGTPAVGMACLAAFDATDDSFYLNMANGAGAALIWGQLASGGWNYYIDFSEAGSRGWYYRRDAEAGLKRRVDQLDRTTLDDDTTQLALRFLMQLDLRQGFSNAAVHDAALYGLTRFAAAQYPGGGYAQIFWGPADQTVPIRTARYPNTWPRVFPGLPCAGYYTINDNVQCDAIRTLIMAYDVYGDVNYRSCALRGGNFLLRAQMPEPQPVWAQQYNFDMEPVWGRRQEPPAVTGGESGHVMLTLTDLWVRSGDARFTATLPAALRWYDASRLPNGLWARFYELRSNRPVYVTSTYRITYQYVDPLPGYALQIDAPEIEEVRRRLTRTRAELLAELNHVPTATEARAAARALEPLIRQYLAELDAQGRWVENGNVYAKTFNLRLTQMADYLIARQRAGM